MADDTCGSNGCLPPGGSMYTGEFWPAVHRGECRFRKDRPATPKPAASEIDEAAAAERARWISNVVTNVYTKEEVNLARAALAWKSDRDRQFAAGFSAALEAIASFDGCTVQEVRSRYGL